MLFSKCHKNTILSLKGQGSLCTTPLKSLLLTPQPPLLFNTGGFFFYFKKVTIQNYCFNENLAEGRMNHITVMESSLRPRSFLRPVSNSKTSAIPKKPIQTNKQTNKTKCSRVAVHTGINHSESSDVTVIYSLPYLLQCKRTTWKILGRALYRWEKASIEVVMMNNLPSFCNSTWKDADFSCALWPLHKKKSCSNTEFPSSSGGSKPVWAHRKHRASD